MTFNLNHPKLYGATWLVVIYVGALLHQFAISTPASALAMWGMLFATAIVITSTLISWNNAVPEKNHAEILISVLAIFCVGFVGYLKPITLPTQALPLSFITLWQLVSIPFYLVIWRRLRSRLALISLITTCVVALLFFFPTLTIPQLGTVGLLTPLLFGFSQSVALLLLLI